MLGMSCGSTTLLADRLISGLIGPLVSSYLHEFSGAREMPMTFEEAEEEQEREPWEDELISFVFTDSGIIAAALTNGT